MGKRFPGYSAPEEELVASQASSGSWRSSDKVEHAQQAVPVEPRPPARRFSRRGAVVEWSESKITEVIRPYREYAYCAGDILVLARLLELSEVSDADGETVKLLLRALKFLRLCDYSAEDICSTLAHASAYFVDAFEFCGSEMDNSEVGHVLTTLLFVAHCYVQDETCVLRVWHEHLFHKYCPLRTLNVAIVRLLEIRNYILRVDTADFNSRFVHLREVMAVVPRAAELPPPLEQQQRRASAAMSQAGSQPEPRDEEEPPQTTSGVLFKMLDALWIG